MFVIRQNDCPLDLRLTLMESGQSFVWKETDERDCFGAVLQGQPVWLRASKTAVFAEGNISVAYIRHYLALDEDYRALTCDDEKLATAVSALPGLRVLRQDAWDVLVQFLISQNNNIVRIRKLCQLLMDSYGEPIATERGILYSLPAPERLARISENELRMLGMGYRAKYLVKTADCVCRGFPLYELCHMPLEQAHKMLCTLPGVGDKVADCVLLFGCAHDNAFPVDIWMERAMSSWYGMREMTRTEMASRARQLFGDYAGIAQQFLFHAARCGIIPIKNPSI